VSVIDAEFYLKEKSDKFLLYLIGRQYGQSVISFFGEINPEDGRIFFYCNEEGELLFYPI